MKILVTGADGQISRCLAERARQMVAIDLCAIGRPILDLGVPGSAERLILETRPDLVINAAADTDVDGAEGHRQYAYRVNADGAGEVAAAANAVGAPIIQLSTDYVFDGTAARPYVEDDVPQPLNAYGRTKLAGEEAVRSGNPNHLILRTAWVFSPFGRNFVKTMFEAADEREELRVIADQSGNPTSAFDLADALLVIARSWQRGGTTGLGQTYHGAGSEQATWHELACEVMDRRMAIGLRVAKLVPIPASDWPMRAIRPKCSLLNCAKLERDFGVRLPGWHQSVGQVVKRLAAQ